MRLSTRRLNCWEYRMCGREPGGLMIATLGPCPVPLSMKHDGLNSGKAAGRACWLVAQTSCVPHRGGSQTCCECHECEFYRRVMSEEAGKIQAAFSMAR